MAKADKNIKLTDGRMLSYAEYGDPNGKPLLFFHGWPGSRLRAKETVDAAKKLGVRLISVDRPGYGLSDYKKDRTLLDWADDVTELADKLRIDKFPVVGVSGGGPYAAACAYKIPNRIKKAGIVVGLAPTYIPGMLDDMPFIYKLGWANYSKYPIVAYLGAWYREIGEKHFHKLLAKIDWRSGADKIALKNLQENNHKQGLEAFRQGSKGARHDLFLYTRDWGFKIKDIKALVYLWYGEADQNVPLAMARYYAKQIKGCRLKVFSNEGHLISITHAEEIFKELTF